MSVAESTDWQWCGDQKPIVHERESYQTPDDELVVGELMNPYGWMLSPDTVEVRR